MQLMHEYVQKSTSTTLPRSDASAAGRPPGGLSQCEMPTKSGALPRTGRVDFAPPACFAAAAAKELPWPCSESRCWRASAVSSTCFWIDVV